MAHGQQQLHSWQRRTVHRLDAQAQRHLCSPSHLLCPNTDCASALTEAMHLP